MPDPTNPLATATALAVGNTGIHTLNASTLNDYYRFTLSGRSSLNLSLTGLDGNADLQLLMASGVVLQQSTNTGTTADGINYTDLSAGVYYIRVLAASGTTSAHYTLALQATQNAKTNLLWRNYATGANALWYMDGTTRISSESLPTVSDVHWRLEGAADFNGDGQADWLWRNDSTGVDKVWLMNGTISLAESILNPVGGANWHLEGTGDFNGDGQTDLVWRNYSTGENHLWLMNGTTYSTSIVLQPVGDANWQLNGVGDFNC